VTRTAGPIATKKVTARAVMVLSSPASIHLIVVTRPASRAVTMPFELKRSQ
jgi:hypothetical protein